MPNTAMNTQEESLMPEFLHTRQNPNSEAMNATHIARVKQDSALSVYAVRGGEPTTLDRFVMSSDLTRDLFNCHKTYGHEFNTRVSLAMANMLVWLVENEVIHDLSSKDAIYEDVIRGGHAGAGALPLLFGTDSRFGFLPVQRVILSEKEMRKGNRESVYSVKQDKLRKSEQGPRDVVVMYDCNATGSTLENALMMLQENYQSTGKGLDTFIYFTIGSSTGEKHLEDLQQYMDKHHPHLSKKVVVVYLEGIFGVDKTFTERKIFQAGTFLTNTLEILNPDGSIEKRPALMTSEYLTSMFSGDTIFDVLEKVLNYDKIGNSGIRVTEPDHHLEDSKIYWLDVKFLAKHGFSLSEFKRIFCEQDEEGHKYFDAHPKYNTRDGINQLIEMSREDLTNIAQEAMQKLSKTDKKVAEDRLENLYTRSKNTFSLTDMFEQCFPWKFETKGEFVQSFGNIIEDVSREELEVVAQAYLNTLHSIKELERMYGPSGALIKISDILLTDLSQMQQDITLLTKTNAPEMRESLKKQADCYRETNYHL